MVTLLLNLPDSLSLFLFGALMFVVTVVIRKVIDKSESVERDAAEELGVKTR